MSGGGGHIRSGSPDPLPVPPPHNKHGHRGDRMRHAEPERQRSQRRRDHDRGYGHPSSGEVRIWNAVCECHLPCFDLTSMCICQHQRPAPPFHRYAG